jgi:hypothetical protein
MMPVLPKSTRSIRSLPVPLSPAIGLITMPVRVCVCVCVCVWRRGGGEEVRVFKWRERGLCEYVCVCMGESEGRDLWVM